MRRLVRAYLLFRWRLLRNSLAASVNRSLSDRLSQWADWIATTVPFLLAIPLALLLGILAFVWGGAAGMESSVATLPRTSLRGVAALGMILTFFTPNWRSAGINASATSRLALLPVPRWALFSGECLSVLANPWILVLLPVCLGFPLGLAVSGDWGAAAMCLLAGLLFPTWLAFMGAMAGGAIELLMRRRVLWEIFLILGLASLVLFPILFQLMAVDGSPSGRDLSNLLGDWAQGPLPWLSRFIPSELYAAAVTGALPKGPWGFLLPFSLLAAFNLVTAVGAWHTWRRAFDTSTQGRRSRSARPGRLLFPPVPGLPRTVRAVTGLQLRNLSRSVRGRVGLVFPATCMLATGLAVRISEKEGMPLSAFSGYVGPLLLWFGMMLSVMMLSAVSQNQFSSDGSGWNLLCLAPLPFLQMAVGKALAHALWIGAAALPCALLAPFLAPPASPVTWITAGILGVAGMLWSLPLGVVLSALFPKTADLSRLGRAGNAHPAAELIAAAAVSAAFSAPLTLAWRVLLGGAPALPLLGYAVFWCVLTAAALGPLFLLAARFAQSRGQAILEAAVR